VLLQRIVPLAVHCRADLAEAVGRFGGYWEVAERLGWKKPSLPRRRWGYWSNLENIKAEVDDVTDEMNIPRGTLPSRQILRKLGYGSISKAIEAQGGFARVSFHKVRTHLYI
jgi:hypothetical protein